jgi:hypothetical protein
MSKESVVVALLKVGGVPEWVCRSSLAKRQHSTNSDCCSKTAIILYLIDNSFSRNTETSRNIRKSYLLNPSLPTPKKMDLKNKVLGYKVMDLESVWLRVLRVKDLEEKVWWRLGWRIYEGLGSRVWGSGCVACRGALQVQKHLLWPMFRV